MSFVVVVIVILTTSTVFCNLSQEILIINHAAYYINMAGTLNFLVFIELSATVIGKIESI